MSKMQSEILNPILELLRAFVAHELALIIFNYLDLNYCPSHLTFFPTKLSKCLGCIIEIPRQNQLIYEFSGPLKIKKRRSDGVVLGRTEIINFHKEDSDFKKHLLEMIPEPKLEYCSENLTDNNLALVLIGNRFNKIFAILDGKREYSPNCVVFKL